MVDLSVPVAYMRKDEEGAEHQEERMAAPIDYAKALENPAAQFAGPADIVAAEGLSKEQKIALLRQWEYDESEIAVATEEGMPGSESRLLQQIALALGQLDPDGAGAGPTKQRVPPTR
jgi:hypothetical protein